MAEVKIPESKFKVGDRVNCLLSPLVGSYATVCNVSYESVFKERHIYNLKNLSKFKNITPYHYCWFDEKDLEFASTKKINKKNDTFTNTYEPNTPNKTIVSHKIEGNKTIVTLSDGSVGIARCNPEDKFDAYTGLKLATERAYGVIDKKLTDTVSRGTITSLSIDGVEIAVKSTPYEINIPKPKFEVGKKYQYLNDLYNIVIEITDILGDAYFYKTAEINSGVNGIFRGNEWFATGLKPYEESQVKEVNRKAKVGEYIKIVNPFFPFGNYKNGDILKAIVSNPTTVIAKDIPIQIIHEEYVVLENYKPEDNEKPKLKFKEGDYVFVRKAAYGCQGANGYRGKVTNLEVTNGLLKYCGLDTTNVRLENGRVWRVNTDGLDFAKSTI